MFPPAPPSNPPPATGARLRVLLVEDSLTMRKHMLDLLSADPDIEVVGEAVDGRQAITMCESLRPDVITMDMALPGTSGLEAIEYIMGHCPTPILVVSSADNRGEVFTTYDALKAGAVDALEKPRYGEAGTAWGQQLRSTVKMVARIRVITHVRATTSPTVYRKARHQSDGHAGGNGYKLIAIGASTGGPGAIVNVLRDLPNPLTVPVLVVQHIDESFGASFCAWLGTQIPQTVCFAVDGEVIDLANPKVILAPANRHLVVQQGRLRLIDTPPRHSCRPSVDHLFESIAQECGGHALACLLTGMGRDGAQGLLDIRRAGGHTIAQDEASSMIFGMPREAIRLGAAKQVLSLGEIGPTLAGLVTLGQEGT